MKKYNIEDEEISLIISDLLDELDIDLGQHECKVTHAQVQRYLRKEENFIITVILCDNGHYDWISYYNSHNEDIDDESEFETYEESLEDALIEALIDLKAWKSKSQEN
jgi:hypothetical protein